MRRHLDNQHANSLIHGDFALILGATEHWIVVILVREGDAHVGHGTVDGRGVLSRLDLEEEQTVEAMHNAWFTV